MDKQTKRLRTNVGAKLWIENTATSDLSSDTARLGSLSRGASTARGVTMRLRGDGSSASEGRYLRAVRNCTESPQFGGRRRL